MEVEPDSIVLKVISCKDLKAFNFFQKLNVYVIASILTEHPNNKNQQQIKHLQHKTHIDREGDGNPEWNHEIEFNLKSISSTSSDQHRRLFLEFRLLSEGTILGDKTIGKVRVPVVDLVNDFNGGVRFVSYQVRSVDGMANGVLNFCYSVNVKDNGTKTDVMSYPPLPLAPVKTGINYPAIEMDSPGTNGSGSGSGSVSYPPLPQQQEQLVHYPPPQPQPVAATAGAAYYYPQQEVGASPHYHSPPSQGYYSYYNHSDQIPSSPLYYPPSSPSYYPPSSPLYYPPPQPQPPPLPQVDPYRVSYGYPADPYRVVPAGHMGW